LVILLVALLACIVAAAIVAVVILRGREQAEVADLDARIARSQAQLDVVDTALAGLGRGSHAGALLGTMTGQIARAVGAARVDLLEEAPTDVRAHRVGSAGWLRAESGDDDALAALAGRLDALLRLVEARRALFQAKVESEALRRSDELKTGLLRALSHELRTPLAAVRASAAALTTRDGLDPEQRGFVDAIDEQTLRLARLIEDLLDYSRLQAGVTPKLDWVDAADVVEDAVEGLEPSERTRVATRAGERVPPLRVDLAFLQRALAILLHNACTYSAGGVVVETRRVRQSVRISVVNPGRGIATDEEERIFEPFYRGRSSAGSAGTGLGLPIARTLVEASGGSLRVERGERLETRLTMTFPVPPRAAP
jgi:two-component system sensor histidine kinase KdpD